PTPEHIRVRNRDAGRAEMLINRRLMVEEQSLVRAVRHSHDVDVPEFRSGFAPVAMRQDLMTTDLASRLNFAATRHRPMKQRVESCDAHAAHGWFHVFEKCRETANDLARTQIFGHAVKFF